HAAIADATDASRDPDRHAWHLAAAAEGPDESVALALEQSAGRAQARGGMAAAAAFLQRAVSLSTDPVRRSERGLAASEASFQAGAFDDALQLLDAAEGEATDEFQRARLELVRARIAFASGFGRQAGTLLLRAAERLQPFDVQLACETYLAAWSA